jgi:hypothetical protein
MLSLTLKCSLPNDLTVKENIYIYISIFLMNEFYLIKSLDIDAGYHEPTTMITYNIDLNMSNVLIGPSIA